MDALPPEDIASEMVAIRGRLESYHELFRALWDLGEPEFTQEVPTAAVVFDNKGAPLRFLFNPCFWKELPSYDRAFVVCHEMLHVVLNHGFRGLCLAQQRLANVAADIAVNHMLVEKFGFVRELLRDWQAGCWVDTVFKDPKEPRPPTNLSMEAYYNLLMQKKGVVLKSLVDVHLFEPINPFFVEDGPGRHLHNRKVAATVGGRLGDLGRAFVADLEKTLGAEGKMAQRGDRPMGVWATIQPAKPTKVSWEDVINRRLRRGRQERAVSGWTHLERRFSTVTDCSIPGLADGSLKSRDGKQRCVFFLDASGSTWDHRDRFFALARTLPRRLFDIELCSFDTQVYKLDLKRAEVKGGGGTSFASLEAYLKKRARPDKGSPELPKPYPDVVIVLTDGYGGPIEPALPERWHWLLTHKAGENIPKASVKIRLADYD